MMDRTTNAIAAGAATNPIWLPTLEGVSQTASLILTILGIVWLIVQIHFKLRGK
jgi:hypothetical protein